MAFFTSFSDPLSLAKPDISTINRLSSQIAGIIYTSIILEQLQAEKIKADISSRELRRLNDFSREIYALTAVDDIVDRIFAYLRYSYDIEATFLSLIDPAQEIIYVYKSTEQDYCSDEMMAYLQNFHIPTSMKTGEYATVLHEKRSLFFKNSSHEITGHLEAELVKKLNIHSLFIIPLIIHHKVLGMITIFSQAKELSFTAYQISSIKRFCNQIPGAIQNALLLQEVAKEKKKSDSLLHAILPSRIADLLKTGQKVTPRFHQEISIMFTDFAGFTKISEKMTPNDLLHNLDHWFAIFDGICEQNRVARIKTIGDGYMAASGLLGWRASHAVDLGLAALQMLDALANHQSQSQENNHWNLRIGLHCGPVISGIIGRAGYQFDIWGDTVNLASRMESSGQIGRINVSEQFYEKVAEFFVFSERGLVMAKQKGELRMFFLESIQPELSQGREGKIPNNEFHRLYAQRFFQQ